ncbi:diacylglycerol O-acyltransferase [Nocardioides psychrotolerans]|uniref:Diacylglycerol O-acyltransferase n=1 Tax=Nocardioides psychrotolerans TaxID=1005945 RepID=A0A1I3G7M8_9ACTN|nr:wax ester/triacylglycerol synthase family O-acyltransferase [Nocardioides psychrotolerans]GEP40630.1 diacylglycerol O-acyltransferase [Nocardioides psychrotolerans]SFI19498.1 diacylglycerol O-acyltransferase [Nocardioides psychrotolerans]
MDRTSALDSAFLHVEDSHSSLHIASLGIFEGPAPTQAEVVAAIERKLPAVPRLRQRLRTVPLAAGRPVWADDPDFHIERHLSRMRVPAPGGEAELREVAGAVLSEALPRDRPLWQDVVLEGLAEDRWALLTKVHHTMADGIAGTDLLATILDRAPDQHLEQDPDQGSGEDEDWAPARPPTPGRLVADAVWEQALLRSRELRGLPRAVGATLRHPVAAARSASTIGQGVLGFARAVVPTTPSSLVGPLGRDREFRWTRISLADALLVRERLGGTVNDVVLAAVTKGFRDLEQARGLGADPNSVRCLVPVSVRRDSSGTLDNEVSALLLTLPVELEDPRDRFYEVATRTLALKESHEAQAGQWALSVADALPPPAVAGFLHLAFRVPHRNLTTVVTNVPGPRTTLYLAGRRMIATYPYVPIADRLRIGVAVTSYGEHLFFGVTTDRDSTPDADVLVDGLQSGFADLLAVASSRRPRKESR